MEDGIKQEIMIERNIECDGNIVMASGKIVRNVWFNLVLNYLTIYHRSIQIFFCLRNKDIFHVLFILCAHYWPSCSFNKLELNFSCEKGVCVNEV